VKANLEKPVDHISGARVEETMRFHQGMGGQLD
jgi:hypothetical protein